MTPYLAVSEESSRRIAEEVSSANPTSDAAEDEEYFRRFRPNMLVSGVKEPFAEDYWQYFRIGGDEVRSNLLRSASVQQQKLGQGQLQDQFFLQQQQLLTQQ